jgi:hypothetical protein
MIGRARQSLSYANVMATVAVFLAVGGGGYALAAGSSRSVIHACATKQGDLRLVGAKAKCAAKEHAVVWNRRGRAGPRGPQGTAGATGATGSAGSPGAAGKDGTARAYTYVNRFNPTTLDAQRTKGFTTLTHPGTGEYCLSGPGLDSRQFPPAATVEFTNTGSDVNDFVQWDSSGFCPVGSYGFITLVQPVVSGAAQDAQFSDAVSFTVVVP